MKGHEEYNGWHNRATWNVALWIDNDAFLYTMAQNFMHEYKGKHPYASFIRTMSMQNARTGDRYKYLSRNLYYSELNDYMRGFLA